MSLSPLVPRLLAQRPSVTGGAALGHQELNAIREDAQKYLAQNTDGRGPLLGPNAPAIPAIPAVPPVPTIPAVPAPVAPTAVTTQNLTSVLETLRREAQRLMDALRQAAAAIPAAPPAPPAPPPPGNTPIFALPPGLTKLIDQLAPGTVPAPQPQPPAAKPDKPKPKPEKPKPKPPKPKPPKDLHANRKSWYISQYKSKFNTREDVPGYDNANCGPTSLTMIAKAFGKIKPNAGGADAAIEDARRRMRDSSSERDGTSVAGLDRGAKSYGLDSKVLWNASSSTVAKELAKGRLVIVHGTVIKDDGRTYGGHYFVVTKIENGKAYLNDPAYPSGPRVIPASILDKSINTRGTRAMISIGP